LPCLLLLNVGLFLEQFFDHINTLVDMRLVLLNHLLLGCQLVPQFLRRLPPSNKKKIVATVYQIFIYSPVNKAVSNSRVYSIKLFDDKSIIYCKGYGTNETHKNPGRDNWSLDTSLTPGALPTCLRYLALHVKCKAVFRICLEFFI
jgi:hypothetical protein